MTRTTLLGLAGLLAAGLGGCSKPLPEAAFSYQEATQKIHAVPFGKIDALATEHKSPANPIQAALLENFGTPNKLVVWEVLPLDFGEAVPDSPNPRLHDRGWKIREGRDLYMVHCVHCHGTAGDGDGPTAKFLEPRPRDYRLGVFKFTSTEGGVKPSRHDLSTIVSNGIPGTSMPAFMLLGEEKVRLLVEYVRFLAMRGEYERMLDLSIGEFASQDAVRKAVDNGGTPRPLTEVEQEIIDRLKAEQEDLFHLPATDIADAWTRADQPDLVVQPREATVLKGAKLYSQIEPRPAEAEGEVPQGRVKLGPQIGEYWQVKSQDDAELGYIHMSFLEARTGIDANGRPTKASLARGRELYMSEDVFCYKCHGLSGRGDGPQTEDYWDVKNTSPARKYEERGLHDDWGHVITPRNLTKNVFRGGRRPIDIYRRLRVGIKGTPMPGFTTNKYKGQPLTDDDFWAIVNYTLSIPFEGASPSGTTAPTAKAVAVSDQHSAVRNETAGSLQKSPHSQDLTADR